MHFNAELNCDSTSVPCLFNENEGRKIVKSTFVLVLLNSCHCRNDVSMLQEESGSPCPEGSFRLNVMYGYWSAILQGEAIDLYTVTNTSTAIVGKGKTFVDVMKTLVIYAEAFLWQYNLASVDVLQRNGNPHNSLVF